MKLIPLVVLWLFLCVDSLFAQQSISLLTSKEPTTSSIAVDGCSADWLKKFALLQVADHRKHLQVFVKSTFDEGNSPSVLGSLSVKENRLCFEPRFPLEPGVEYFVRYREDEQSEWQVKVVGLPKKTREATTVVRQIYPTADQLPQNLLKFYVYFSEPMTQGVAYEHVELQGAGGKRVPFPFLEIAEELWDRSGQRLTLLLDPGRVKRGLVPREEDGPILTAGSRYRLIIKATWPDAQGTPLAKTFIKNFTVVAEDFRQPDPATWKIKPPQSKTRDPLTIIMPESMDHATFARGVTIENEKGQVVFGEFTFSNQETQAHFTPTKQWRPGLFDIRILKRIEDLVGNSIARPFEVDRFDNVAETPNDRATITTEIR